MVLHLVSGQAFFSGMLLIATVILARLKSEGYPRRILTLSAVLGLLLIVVSAAPLPDWYHAMLGATLGMWLGCRRSSRWISTACVMVISLGIALELPFHRTPSAPAKPITSLAIIGDSVSAGTGGDDDSITWPTLLAEKNSVHVQDLSHMGETAGSALKRLQQTHIDTDAVLVEIGGNDILGTTSPQQFYSDLEALLREISRQVDMIYMFELPLPPFFDQYGKSQRVLARKYGVKLIPKRYFASLILDEDMTSDGIHLSQTGHNHMAFVTAEILNLRRAQHRD